MCACKHLRQRRIEAIQRCSKSFVPNRKKCLLTYFAQKSIFGWRFRPKVDLWVTVSPKSHFWVTVSLKSRFLGDGFAQKSIFGWRFRPKVDFRVTVSPKSPFLGDGFAQNGNYKFKIMQKCGKSGNRKIPVYFLYGRPIFPGRDRAGVCHMHMPYAYPRSSCGVFEHLWRSFRPNGTLKNQKSIFHEKKSPCGRSFRPKGTLKNQK